MVMLFSNIISGLLSKSYPKSNPRFITSFLCAILILFYKSPFYSGSKFSSLFKGQDQLSVPLAHIVVYTNINSLLFLGKLISVIVYNTLQIANWIYS